MARLTSDVPFKLLVQSVVDYAIFMLDPTGKVSTWNVGAERIKGYSAKEIIGKHFSNFYTPEDRKAKVPQTALKTAKETGRYEAEGWRVRKDGTHFWASVVIDAIRDPDGKLLGFAKVTRDLTDKRETQLRLEESREQLFRAQKMEALGQLTGGLAHDFNNLLTAILGGADLALRKVSDRDRVTRMLEGIRASAQRGASLTRQLLAFARAQALDITTVDLRDFLNATTTLLRPSMRSNIEIVIELSDQLWPVDTDPGALELALLNLAFNARDAMPDGGKLHLSATNQILDGTPDGLRGEYVAIRISDTGSGMSSEVMDRVFEPFFTTKGFGEGTGLGLSQVFGFAKQLHGALTVESKLGRGSTFTLYLPANHGGLHADLNGSSAKHAPNLGKVMIVEDDLLVAELAAGMLADIGFEPAVVHSAKEALDRLVGGDRPKLIFTDIVMPGGISGLELAQKVRDRFPEMPILLTTGYSEQVGGTHGFPVLQKPYELNSLVGALQKILKHELVLN